VLGQQYYCGKRERCCHHVHAAGCRSRQIISAGVDDAFAAGQSAGPPQNALSGSEGAVFISAALLPVHSEYAVATNLVAERIATDNIVAPKVDDSNFSRAVQFCWRSRERKLRVDCAAPATIA